jgi:uncharacterized protein (DUF2141 family)
MRDMLKNIGLWVSAAMIAIASPSFALEPPVFDINIVQGSERETVIPYLDVSQPLGACADNEKHDEIRITINNIRIIKGSIRMSLYGSDKKEWLAKGKKLVRFDVPVTSQEMIVCMPLPRGPGIYALGMFHDEDANRKFAFFSEGFGVSNNAKRGFFKKPPPFKKTRFETQAGRNDLTVRMRY